MTKKRKVIIIVVALVTMVLIGGMGYPYVVNFNGDKLKSAEEYTYNENILIDFIENKLSNSEGDIYTNFKDYSNDGDITKGHSILSESEGMMLMYYITLLLEKVAKAILYSI